MFGDRRSMDRPKKNDSVIESLRKKLHQWKQESQGKLDLTSSSSDDGGDVDEIGDGGAEGGREGKIE